MTGDYISVAEAEARWPGCTLVIRSLYVNGRIDGEDDPSGGLVFYVTASGDWRPLPPGTLVFPFTGYEGITWWEQGRWLYSDFGSVCCSSHRPDGADHGVYEFLCNGVIGEKVR